MGMNDRVAASFDWYSTTTAVMSMKQYPRRRDHSSHVDSWPGTVMKPLGHDLMPTEFQSEGPKFGVRVQLGLKSVGIRRNENN